MMRIGLVQVDGKWPNLALMKLSTWHKKQGGEVEFFTPLRQYDAVYASKVFDFTPDSHYLPTDAITGGTGYSIASRLPDEVEECFPDYSLYGNPPFAIGFTTRGCPNHCRLASDLGLTVQLTQFARGGVGRCLARVWPKGWTSIYPQSLGGGDVADNLQTLCFSCNSRKRDRAGDYRGGS